MKKTASIIQDETNPVDKPVLATAIVEMSAAVKRLQKSGINLEAIIVLTQHHCRPVGSKYAKVKPSASVVKVVLESLADLERAYTRP